MKQPIMHTALPTGDFASWTITSLRDSLISELAADVSSDALQMFFYAITRSGWSEVQKTVTKWMKAKSGRSVTVYVGTDHAITDPAAIELMQQAGVDVRLMSSYRGVFHPKVVWLQGKSRNLLWVCSNNLTRDGFLNHVEFGVLVRDKTVPAELARWVAGVAAGSSTVTSELLESYRKERDRFEKECASAKATTFTWTERHEPKREAITPPDKGDLIVEIMPEETRGGTQVQLPKDAAKEFFGLERVGDQKSITLQRKGSPERRSLVVTVFKNHTVRLSVNELEYRDRPCVIVFSKRSGDAIVFEIVPENIFPSRYRMLIEKCNRQTRGGSRRWSIE